MHDDTVGDLISVTQEPCHALLRIVVFLGTDLNAPEISDNSSWPFKNIAAWNEHRSNVEEDGIPSYYPDIHALPVHGPFDRIPTLVGFVIIVLASGAIIALLLVTR